MWPQSIWALGSTITLAVAASATAYSYASPISSQFPENGNVHPAPRQLTPPIPTNPTTTSTTFDFWWPFPAATTTSPVITVPIAPVASVIAASSAPSTVPSLASDSSSVPSNSLITSPTSTSPTSLTSSSTSSSAVSHSASSSAAPASGAASKAPFKLIYLVPAFSAVGIFLLALVIWVLYGCCTRRPRIRTDDGELICGPPYIGNNENDARRDIEDPDHDQEDIGMLEIPKHGRRGISGQFRWPSFNEPPSFDPVKGFHVPDEYKKDDDDDYLTASLLVPPTAGNGRSKSSRTQRSTATKRSARAGPSGVASIFSDATSVALLDLYESNEEAEEKRRAKEIPWESLRHKSIKRGILEQVKKENKWMDSIRGSIAGGSAFLSGHGSMKSKGEDDDRLPPDTQDEDERRRDERPIGKRRGHVRADSDLFFDTVYPASSGVPTKGLSEQPATMPLKPSKPKGSSEHDAMMPTSGVRRGFAWLKDDPETLDKYIPLPTRVTESRSKSRSRSRSRSRSSSPIKKSSASARSWPISREGEARPLLRDMLPNSPPQIMSPPLESQMCFTPIPLPIDAMSTTSRTRSKSTSGKDVLLSKISTPSKKSRKLHARNPPALPFPGSDGLTSPRPEAYRGRLVKKKSAVPDTSSYHKKPPARPPYEEASNVHSTVDGNEALKKVDKIMENSWCARDLEDEAIRCLSPSGFGKQVY